MILAASTLAVTAPTGSGRRHCLLPRRRLPVVRPPAPIVVPELLPPRRQRRLRHRVPRTNRRPEPRSFPPAPPTASRRCPCSSSTCSRPSRAPRPALASAAEPSRAPRRGPRLQPARAPAPRWPGAFGQGSEVGHDLLVRRGVRRFGRHDRMPPAAPRGTAPWRRRSGRPPRTSTPSPPCRSLAPLLASDGVRVGVGGFAAVVPLWIVMLARALREVLPDDTHGVASRGKRASPPGFVRSDEDHSRRGFDQRTRLSRSNRLESHSV